MKKFTILLSAMLLFAALGYSQVAINTDGTAPDSSAILDVNSTTRGLLLPRMTTVQISGISTPAAGLLVYNTDSSDFYGYNGSKWISFWDTNDTISPWVYGDPITDTRDGQTYNTVQIGNQCWMAENLNYQTTDSWWYNNSSTNGNIYGRLYTWEAALTACPSGWSLPSDDQWKQMEIELGMSQSEADNTDWRGTYEGEKMKSTSGWHNNGNGTNSSGFNALPGGYRESNGSFSSLGSSGYWWSSSVYSGTDAWYRNLGYFYDKVYRYNYIKTIDFSVRCVKD